jgi:predicted Zn finger-like uncharacterized protein
MKKSDVVCPECGAGFRRLELTSLPSTDGEYRCPACSKVLETSMVRTPSLPIASRGTDINATS